jgi:hypothetical protein
MSVKQISLATTPTYEMVNQKVISEDREAGY